MDCESKEEQIYAQASTKGISHDVIYDSLDTAMVQVTSRLPGKSAGWRLENVEQGVWAKFCKWTVRNGWAIQFADIDV